MKTRILSGCIMLPLLVIVFLGDKVLLAGCFVIAMLGIREFYNGFDKMEVRPCRWIGYLAAVTLYAIGVLRTSMVIDTNWYLLWLFAMVFLSFLYLFRIDERKLEDGMATIIGIVYVVFFSFHIVLIDQTQHGILVWLVIFASFGADIFAYFAGMAFGKRKLCPKISPKKTVAGCIGGFVGSTVLCFLFGLIFVSHDLLIHCIIIGVIAGGVAQLGDLTASIFKRKMGIKDYGNLIPGHGGILDRFDSVLFTAPIIYYYISLVIL